MPAGRPRLQLNPDNIEDLASIGCTDEEIASILKCSPDTLTRNFAEALKNGRDDMRMSLRRQQYMVAMNGSKKGEHASPAMLIWLGKQLLGQRDAHEVSGPGGGAIKHEHYDFSNLSAEQLSELEALVESAASSLTDGGERGEAKP